ncbi:MAG: chloride channel protein [Deltaproteobacteria bacterium]|nr:chloride channel protein [Deltaproteobacteria bacterium]
MTRILSQLQGWWSKRNQQLLPIIFAETAPLDLRIVGRMLLHAALVGAAAGLAGVLFFGGLEYTQRFLLEALAGYTALKAHGETFATHEAAHTFRPWLLVLLPALGGLACGLVTRFAPETRGGGGDAMIDAFHHKGGVIRARVIWMKALASLCTLGTGGAGGREGPTMQIGGALGSLVARVLKVGARERRILLVAGVAAGISAVFRTPLGAALLAVEVLYRDGFESDALVPSILASVVAYSIVISVFGESTLLAHAPRFGFVPAHLPLYGLLALIVAALAAAFVSVLRSFRQFFKELKVPDWVRPGVGGLLLGVLSTSLILAVGAVTNTNGQGIGLLGGGYGAVQMAISGSPWLPDGWLAVELLLLLSVTKILAASLTIGSEGSAGDFAPSLAIGGLCGGAFGRAAQLLLQDPRLDPGAFALVGMGVFYGGIAHVPLSALVLVCELAGNYDLLVPLMLAQGIAFIALRKRQLYDAQVPTQRDSPVHRETLLLDVLKAIRVRDFAVMGRPFVTLSPRTAAGEILRHASEATWQSVFPVAQDGKLVGLVSAANTRILASERADTSWALAADIMQPPLSVYVDDDLRTATEKLVSNGLRAIPVVNDSKTIVGFLDESDVAKAYLKAAGPDDSYVRSNTSGIIVVADLDVPTSGPSVTRE